MTAGQRWSRERPTKKGWYWYRHKPEWEPRVMFVTTELRVAQVGFEGQESMDVYSGEWQGPITPHDQEAG